MARSSYNLQIFKTIPLESANGTTYTARIWTSYSGGVGEWKLASNGLKLDWESTNVQDKNLNELLKTSTKGLTTETKTYSRELDPLLVQIKDYAVRS